MSNAKRPGVQRKVTRAVKEKQDAALNEGISVKVDGEVYTVTAGDLSGLDAMALRREAGYSFIGLMRALQADPDIDLIAAIIWLSRRINGEQMLSYAEVASGIGYDVEIDIVDEPEVPDEGESSGGDS